MYGCFLRSHTPDLLSVLGREPFPLSLHPNLPVLTRCVCVSSQAGATRLLSGQQNESATVLESLCLSEAAGGSSISYPAYGVKGQREDSAKSLFIFTLPGNCLKEKGIPLPVFGFRLRTLILAECLRQRGIKRRRWPRFPSSPGIVLPGCSKVGCRLPSE